MKKPTTGLSNTAVKHNLSWRADQLFIRIKNGKFYRPYVGDMPHAMKEMRVW